MRPRGFFHSRYHGEYWAVFGLPNRTDPAKNKTAGINTNRFDATIATSRNLIFKVKKTIWKISVVISIVGLFACKEKPDGRAASGSSIPAIQDSSAAKVNTNTDSVPLHPPVDEWELSLSLSAFKNKLLLDLESGDQLQILAAFSEGIHFNPGTDKGPAGVVELWGLDGSKEKPAPLKTLLDSLISNGGCIGQIVGDSAFTAPSYNCVSKSVKAACEGKGCGVVPKGGAALHKAADPKAETGARLAENEVVTLEGNTGCDSLFDNCTWRKITRANGDKGFLRFSDLLTESDGFIRIDKESIGWRIRVLKGPGILTDDV